MVAVCYRKKYGVMLNTCCVHPLALEDSAIEVGGVRVMPKPTVLRGDRRLFGLTEEWMRLCVMGEKGGK